MNKLSGVLLEAAHPDGVERKIAASLERRRLRFYIILLILDAGMLHGAFMLASKIYLDMWWHHGTMLAGQALLPIYFTIALYNRSYSVAALEDWFFALRQAMTA
ncbi:MAG: sugar transferase, partial [Pseudomonadota bacterium]